MNEDDIRRIAREEIRNHEARFTVSGVALAIAAAMVWLVCEGRF